MDIHVNFLALIFLIWNITDGSHTWSRWLAMRLLLGWGWHLCSETLYRCWNFDSTTCFPSQWPHGVTLTMFSLESHHHQQIFALLLNVSRCLSLLTTSAATTLVHAAIIYHLDYWPNILTCFPFTSGQRIWHSGLKITLSYHRIKSAHCST